LNSEVEIYFARSFYLLKLNNMTIQELYDWAKVREAEHMPVTIDPSNDLKLTSAYVCGCGVTLCGCEY
jgi:hypothetical protein